MPLKIHMHLDVVNKDNICFMDDSGVAELTQEGGDFFLSVRHALEMNLGVSFVDDYVLIEVNLHALALVLSASRFVGTNRST